MITSPWHSTRLGETVYHNNTACTEGNNIESYYYAPGDGGRLKLCHRCATLAPRGILGSLSHLARPSSLVKKR